MSIEDELILMKKKVDIELERFFEFKIGEIKKQKKPEELLNMTLSIKNFTLNSGKRIRPILFYYGYLIGGGERKKEALRASISVEFMHSYLLIHDDIIDQDDYRHNDFSMHYGYEKKFQNKIKKEKIKHFGMSMAIMAGDLTSIYSHAPLISSKFSPEIKMKAIKKMNEIILDTITGETADVILSNNDNFDIAEIIEMQKYKTARYTIDGPLRIGAVLSGADDKFINSLSGFAIPLGIAFQIKDDIMGIFGDIKKTGKPIGSDIKEGKKTLLTAKAIEGASENQKKIIYSAMGNKKISYSDMKKIKDIILNTGSLDYSKKKAEDLIKLSMKNLDKIDMKPKYKKFLIGLSNFIINRSH